MKESIWRKFLSRARSCVLPRVKNISVFPLTLKQSTSQSNLARRPQHFLFAITRLHFQLTDKLILGLVRLPRPHCTFATMLAAPFTRWFISCRTRNATLHRNMDFILYTFTTAILHCHNNNIEDTYSIFWPQKIGSWPQKDDNMN